MSKNLAALVSVIFFFVASNAYADRYAGVLEEMSKLQASAPGFVNSVEIGTNDQGKSIAGVRIARPGTADLVPFLVVGAHHGNEGDSVTVALDFAKKALKALQSETNPWHSELRDGVFYVIPVLNIGGYNNNQRSERDSKGNSYDPNRDYPDPCAKKTNFNLKSTRNLAAYVKTREVVAAVTIHGYIGTFTYPWGIFTDQTHTDDQPLFDQVASYAVKANGYRIGTHTDVIYPTAGAFEDWAYHSLGTWVTLLEVADDLDAAKDADALIRYFAKIPRARSNRHEHHGACTNDFWHAPDTIKARP